LFEQHRANQPNDSGFIGEDAAYVGAAFHFIVESLELLGTVQFAAALLGGVEIIAAALPRCRRVRLEGAALPIRDRDRLAC
jgi:hypothetical protein